MIEWIDNIVLGLIENYNTNDVYELCNCLNIKIVKLDSSNILLKKRDAYYYRDLEDREVIFIRNNLHLSLEKFILKHELGHAVCHTELLCVGYTFSNKDKLEKQANYFAFKLSDLHFDEVELYEMSLEQICCTLEIPFSVVNQLVDM